MKSWLINKLHELRGGASEEALQAVHIQTLNKLAALEEENSLLKEEINHLDGELDKARVIARGAAANESRIASRVGRLQTERPDIHEMYFVAKLPRR